MQCQLVAVHFDLAEVEVVSVVPLDFARVLVDDGVVVHGVDPEPGLGGHHHKLHVRLHHLVQVHQEGLAYTGILSLPLRNC